MTKEEAIKLLHVEKSLIIEVDGNKGAEKMLQAYDMAIEALSADTIPRHDVEIIIDEIMKRTSPTHGRLIDADALLDKLPKEYFGSTIHLLINDAPTVSADRLHGEWVDDCDPLMRTCSNCGYGVFIQNVNDFCPNCGARMAPYKGGDEE